MHLNVRKRRFIRRMLGYATNPVAVRWRTARGTEQDHDIGGIRITLPPGHNLPFYQKRDPTYDAYAISILRDLAAHDRLLTVIDVGANVGDTAAAILASNPNTSVISVEGDPCFVSYLHRNLRPHARRATVVEGFVGPVGTHVSYSRHGTTGGFNTTGTEDDQQVLDWITPEHLVQRAPDDHLVVWKSDIDGFDIHVLVEHWDAIMRRCEVLWFEYDPASTLGNRSDIVLLLDLLADSGLVCLVYDNLGRKMLTLGPGVHQSRALGALTGWLMEQRDGHVCVPYVDIWALTPDQAEHVINPDAEHLGRDAIRQ